MSTRQRKLQISIWIIVAIISITSCKTLGPPEDAVSAGLYGYIEFEEGLYFDDKNLNIVFYPIEGDASDLDITKDINKFEKFNLITSGIMGKRSDNNAFWIANIPPGTYGLILLEDEYQRMDVWYKPISSIVEVKEGQLNYWGATFSTLSDNDDSSFVSESHFDITREDVLDLLEEKLLENNWGEWLDRERQTL